jgi:uncharacterized damage-inducible protein DinB
MTKPGLNAGRPAESEYASYYERYVSQVPETDVVAALDSQTESTLGLLRDLPEELAGHRYEPSKWSVAELLGHIVDSERVFAYRLLTFARGGSTALPGFDQDEFMAGADFSAYTLAELASEYEYVRRATSSLLRHLPGEAWQRTGVASDAEVSVRGLAYIILGHERHHLAILRERYLGAAGGASSAAQG